MLPGTTRPGIACGATATSTASASRIAVVLHRTGRRHGIVFSAAITAAITAIHTRLITPSAKNAAMSAQQHPTHQAACRAPIATAPVDPSRQLPSRKPSAGDCWAVGTSGKPLIEHYTGSSWAIVSTATPTPALSPSPSELDGVICVTAGDCWAVGSSGALGDSGAQPLIEHYAGSSWTIVRR